MKMDDFFHTIEKGDCPSPPRVVLQLFERMEDPQAGVSDIANLVRRDPVIAAKAIKLANSVLYQGLRPAVAIEDAITRIGLSALARLALGISLIQQHPALGEFMDLPRYWSAALLRGVVMQALARRYNSGSPTEAFTLGLLAEIGRLAMACATPEIMEPILSTARDDSHCCELERGEFGFDHHQLSAALLERWKLPAVMTLAICGSPSREGERLPRRSLQLREQLNLARRFSDYAEGLFPDVPPPLSEEVLAKFELDESAVESLQGELASQWRELADLFELEAPPDLLRRLDSLRENEPYQAESTEWYSCEAARKVLLVDDDTDSRAILRHMLEPVGFRVLEAEEMDAAIAVVEREMPRILLVGWRQAEKDSLGFCQRLRERFGGQVYIYLISSNTPRDQSLVALEAGADDIIEKPLSPRLLAAKLRMARQHVAYMLSLEAAQHRIVPS